MMMAGKKPIATSTMNRPMILPANMLPAIRHLSPFVNLTKGVVAFGLPAPMSLLVIKLVIDICW